MKKAFAAKKDKSGTNSKITRYIPPTGEKYMNNKKRIKDERTRSFLSLAKKIDEISPTKNRSNVNIVNVFSRKAYLKLKSRKRVV